MKELFRDESRRHSDESAFGKINQYPISRFDTKPHNSPLEEVIELQIIQYFRAAQYLGNAITPLPFQSQVGQSLVPQMVLLYF